MSRRRLGSAVSDLDAGVTGISGVSAISGIGGAVGVVKRELRRHR